MALCLGQAQSRKGRPGQHVSTAANLPHLMWGLAQRRCHSARNAGLRAENLHNSETHTPVDTQSCDVHVSGLEYFFSHFPARFGDVDLRVMSRKSWLD